MTEKITSSTSKKQQILTYSGIAVAAVFYISFISFMYIRFRDPKELIQTITELYATYGYYLVFFGALIESTFLIGLYFPGSAIVLLGAATAKSGVLFLPFVILLATVSFSIGFTINYFLGKHGWYHVLAKIGLEGGITEAQKRLKSHRYKTIFLGYFNPGSAAFISTAAGVMKVPIKQFVMASICATLFWNTVWGIIAYTFGLTLVEYFIKYFGFVVMGFVSLYLLRKYHKERKLKKE